VSNLRLNIRVVCTDANGDEMLYFVDDLQDTSWSHLFATDADSHREAAGHYIEAIGLSGVPVADPTCADRLLVWADRNGLIRYGSKKAIVFGIDLAVEQSAAR